MVNLMLCLPSGLFVACGLVVVAAVILFDREAGLTGILIFLLALVIRLVLRYLSVMKVIVA